MRDLEPYEGSCDGPQGDGPRSGPPYPPRPLLRATAANGGGLPPRRPPGAAGPPGLRHPRVPAEPAGPDRRLQEWQDRVEEAIREAEARGLFRDLPGAGRPLRLDENPFEPPAWRLGHRLLRQHGFAPEWIELDREIRRDLEAARALLDRTLALVDLHLRQASPPPSRPDRGGLLRRWLRRVAPPPPAAPPDPTAGVRALAAEAERRFEELARSVNARIRRFNLIVPIPWLQRRPVDIPGELDAFRRAVAERLRRYAGDPEAC